MIVVFKNDIKFQLLYEIQKYLDEISTRKVALGHKKSR